MGFEILGRVLNQVGVVGSGNIGPDIALHMSKVLTPHGTKLVVVDISEEALASGQARINKKLAKGVETGAFKEDQAKAISSNIEFTTDYSRLAAADLVVEAATEDEGIKHRIFSELEKQCSESTILTSNSSHMEPEVIFSEMKNKARTAVTHYFFPAERNIVVEVVPGAETDAATARWLMSFYEAIGKAPVQVKSRYGYAVDPIFEGIFLASALAVEDGLGTVKEIDAIAQKTLRMGVGPFTAMNLTGGNPLTSHGLDVMHEKTNKWYRQPQIMKDVIASGKPWDTPGRGEKVEVEPDREKAIADCMMGAYFGLVGQILDTGITSLGDLEMAVETALVVTPPFQTMNKLGVGESLALVRSYHEKHPNFPVPKCIEEQASLGRPFDIPVVFREDHGNVAVVRIRRPRVLNALNSSVMAQVRAHFEAIQKDGAIEAAVLTGFGTKAFVSGADINELASLQTADEAAAHGAAGQDVLNFIENLGKPVICAMNGLAFGGGNELAMSCTARIARKGLRVLSGQPEPNLGIIPGYGGTQRLPRIVGFKHAWEMLRTGRPISSARALEIGLISREVEGDLVEAGVMFARDLLAGNVDVAPIPKDPIEVPGDLPEVDLGHLSRKIDEIQCRVILEGAAMNLYEGLKHETRVFGDCLDTRDTKIGLKNFIENGPKVKASFVHE